LKALLLAAEGSELIAACTNALSKFGFTVKPSRDKQELHLSDPSRSEILVRIVHSPTQAQRSDVAQLAESVITFWGEHEVEPKGVLIACSWTSLSPAERVEPDFSEGLSEFAEKKNLCLMSTAQLLSVYKDLETGKLSSDEIRRKILQTNGRLEGFQLETSLATI
jgi:hypothetical protein